MSAPETFDSIAAVRRWNPEIAEWREAADEGRLLLKTCGDCGRAHYYPRTLCPFCFSADTRWVEAGGKGEIYTFAVEQRGQEPFVIAYITLDDGPTIMTNLIGIADLADIRIGGRVALNREASRGRRAPLFQLTAA